TCQGLSAKTDAVGRYEIRGARKANSYALFVGTDLAAGLVGRRLTVADTNGYAPVTADIAVDRGAPTVVVTGRIIDSATGKGLRGHVQIAILHGNRFARGDPEMQYIAPVPTAEDGTFRVVTIPGPVLLIGRVSDTYKPARADPKYPRYFPAEEPSMYRTVGGAVYYISGNSCKV